MTVQHIASPRPADIYLLDFDSDVDQATTTTVAGAACSGTAENPLQALSSQNSMILGDGQGQVCSGSWQAVGPF